jgi:ADP-dependent NAD(P)H-hydrate dehydratase / NAD(P)H-hydrate epimerase
MKALTAAEMREVDRLTTERFGIPSIQLMENAGHAVADVYRRIAYTDALRTRSICVLCGKGNNGGDGFVAARDLKAVVKAVRVCLFANPDELRGDAATNLQRWRDCGGEVVSVIDEKTWDAVKADVLVADVIVDAIFGTGFRGALSGAIAQAIEDINKLSRDTTAARPALILAVDTPSGLPSDGQSPESLVLRAHQTVTFTAPKIGQLISNSSDALGKLSVVDIGSPATLIDEVGKGALRWSEPGEFARLPLVRQTDGHKGLYGHILIVAGSVGKSGAAVMAGSGALLAGAGLVTIATPDAVLPIVSSAHPELMTEPLVGRKDGTISRENLANRLSNIAKGKTIVAIGPGLGQDGETREFIHAFVQQTNLPIILDADGLNAFAGQADKLRERKTEFLAITPHPGEMARLLNCSTKDVQADRVKAAQEAAKRWNAHVVLKGAHTIIAAPSGAMFVNTTGNPGLAKGGSGDTLTGILAAMTGQFKTDDWLRVLVLGVYLHGAAADLAVAGTDPSGLLASEVAAAVPKARRELLRELQRRA